MNFSLRLRLLAMLATLTSAAAGLWAIIAWGLGEWKLLRLGADHIPMAPPTAILFAVLGLALAARLQWPDSRAARHACLAGAFLTLTTAGLTVLQSWFDLALPWEHWFLAQPAMVGAIPVGRMSPVTAAAFVLTALALLGRSRGFAGQPSLDVTAALAAGVGFVTGAVVAIGYAAGTPLLYGGRTVPMALLTALAFMALNAAPLLVGPVEQFLRDWHARDHAPHVPKEHRIFSRRLLLAVAGIGLFIALAGFFYLRHEQASARQGVHAQLEAIARLKAEQITGWRTERMNEARFLGHTPAVIRDVAALMSAQNDPVALARVNDWLEPIKGGERYKALFVFDPQARLVLAIPASAAATAHMHDASLANVLAGPEPVFADLQRHPGDPAPHLDLLIAIRSGPASVPAAIIVMQLDPRQFLQPLLRSWPVPSATAESVLVRREGDAVVFLSELRHRPDAPLMLRRSILEPDLVAAKAVRGEPGVREGVDYRGVPVLAVSHAIPDSPWNLVAKIDQEEIYRPIRNEAAQIALMVGLLLLVVLLTGISLWRRRYADTLHRALAAEQGHHAMAERLGLVMRYANDSIMIMEIDGRIREANECALTTYGYTIEELRALPAGGLHPAASANQLGGQMAAFATDAGTVFETLHRRKDGTVFPMEVSGRRVMIDGRPHLLGIYRNITERKAHEQEIDRLNRMYFVISQVNQTIVRAKSQAELFPEICRVLVKFGRFRIAWIGWLDPESRLIRPVAVAGDEHGYVSGITISTDPDRPESRGPSSAAFREGRLHVCNDFFGDPALQPWHERARPGGFQSSIALPLRQEGAVRGLLAVYAAEKNFFGPQEIPLLEEAAGDISYALDVLAGQERSRAAETALQRSKQDFSRAFLSSPTAVCISTVAEGRFLDINDAWQRLSGYRREEVIGRTTLELQVWAEAKDREEIRRLIAAGRPVSAREERFRRKDGALLETLLSVEPIGFGGEPCLISTIIDITGQKQAQQKLTEQIAELRRWHEATLGREERILELKREVNKLLARAGAPARYPSAQPGNGADDA